MWPSGQGKEKRQRTAAVHDLADMRCGWENSNIQHPTSREDSNSKSQKYWSLELGAFLAVGCNRRSRLAGEAEGNSTIQHREPADLGTASLPRRLRGERADLRTASLPQRLHEGRSQASLQLLEDFFELRAEIEQ